MKLNKIYVNINDKKDDVQKIDGKITEEDIKNDFLGYHIVMENKTSQLFNVNFLMLGDSLQYSLDMKKTVKDCLTIEYNLQSCKLTIKENEKLDIIIWTKELPFQMDKVKINIGEYETGDLDSLYLSSTFDKQFLEIFGFPKKYHFDQYRMLLVISLCNSQENQKLITELVNKIIKDAKMERKIEETSQQFFETVFNNLLEENAGPLDMFTSYRGKIINKLRLKVDNIGKIINNGETIIDVRRNVIGNAGLSMVKQIELGKIKKEEPKEFEIDKKIDNNPFERNKIEKTIKYQSVENDVFLLVEIGRKGQYMSPQNSVILFKYGNSSITEIEKTIEKIILATIGESYEIVLYLELTMIAKFEALVENLFFNYDNLKKIKIICKKNKIGKFNSPFSEIQKLIILSHFINPINPYFFIVSINSWFPKRYMQYIKTQFKENLMMIKRCYVMYESGRVDIYEGSGNSMFGYFAECIFPVMPLTMLRRLSYNSVYFGSFSKFRDFKNFLEKNGTVKSVDMLDFFDNGSIHKFEG